MFIEYLVMEIFDLKEVVKHYIEQIFYKHIMPMAFIPKLSQKIRCRIDKFRQ